MALAYPDGMPDVSERYKEALRLGHVAVAQGRPREALQHYEAAGRLAGHRPLPFVSMGSVLLQMHRPQEALLAFEEALARAPDDVPALRGKASALDSVGRGSEAAVLLARAASLESPGGEPQGPARREARSPTADAEAQVVEAERARASGSGDKAMVALLGAARAYSASGAQDAALDACHRALEISPGHPQVHLVMTAIYLERGWRQHALERLTLLDRILWLEPLPAARAELEALVSRYRDRFPELSGLARPPA